jgi:formate C-acetyltransferase
MSGKQIVPGYERRSRRRPADFDEVWAKYDRWTWAVGTYVEALNIIHYSHDKYAYEAIEMALHDDEIVRTMGCGIAGLSIVADSLSAIKYAKVTPVRDESGLVVDYVTEGEFPMYGNDDDRADEIAVKVVKTVMDKIRSIKLYRDAVPTQSVLTITSNVVYGKATGSFPCGHKEGHPVRAGREPGERRRHPRHGRVHAERRQARLRRRARRHLADQHHHPPALGRTEEERVANLVGILDAGFAEGLYHANINVLNRETLLDAMENPENYPQLTIRVSGYAVNFVKLTREQQLDVLSRTFHESV